MQRQQQTGAAKATAKAEAEMAAETKAETEAEAKQWRRRGLKRRDFSTSRTRGPFWNYSVMP